MSLAVLHKSFYASYRQKCTFSDSFVYFNDMLSILESGVDLVFFCSLGMSLIKSIVLFYFK